MVLQQVPGVGGPYGADLSTGSDLYRMPLRIMGDAIVVERAQQLRRTDSDSKQACAWCHASFRATGGLIDSA